MSSAQSTAPAAQAENPAPAPGPEPFVSTFKPSPPPTAEARAETTKLAELCQLTLDNGRIIDLPAAVLQEPAPTPAEFLHLQHYFGAHRGAPVDLSACESADEAVDVLADEVEALRLLVYGYAVNFKRYVDRFEAAHDELRREVLSVAESYDGLARLVVPAEKTAKAVEGQFWELQKKIAALPVGSHRPPPKIAKRPRGGLSNPALSAEENQKIKERELKRFEERSAAAAVAGSAKKLADAAILKDIMQPPRPAKKPAKKRSRTKQQTFTHELQVKVEKVVEGVEAAREQLHAAQEVTKHGLIVLRYLEEDSQKDAKELWTWYDLADRSATIAGKLSKHNEYRAKVLGKWTDECAKDAAASSAEPSAENDAQAVDSGPPLNNLDDDAADSPATPLPAQPSAEAGPPPMGDLYAVTLDLSCEKPYDELTREEAIDVLKSLPLRVHFVPYAAPDEQPGEKNDDDVDMVNGDAKPAESAPEAVCPSPARPTAAAAEEPETAPPAAAERDLCESKPRSRKRTRKDNDGDDGDADVTTGVEPADPRPKSGGSPVKKKRGGNA